MELAAHLKAESQFGVDDDEIVDGKLATLNTFKFFCPFCIKATTFENNGNFSKCQSCHMYGSNFWQNCAKCGKGSQYCYIKDGEPEHDAKCPRCVGCAWSGDAESIKDKKSVYCVNCEDETEWNIYSQDIHECSKCQVVQLIGKNVEEIECQTCPGDRELDEEQEKRIFFHNGDLMCELCWLQSIIQVKAKQAAKEARKDRKKATKTKLPDEYSYFCAFCSQITQWNNLQNERSKCTQCEVVGSNQPKRCSGCREKQYIFYGDKQKQCIKCCEGFGPKSITGIAPMNCIFCEDTLQTWYIYEAKGKMKCTNCDGVMPSRQPLVPEQCPVCYKLVESGLLTYQNITRCMACFRAQLCSQSKVRKGPRMKLGFDDDEDCAGQEVTKFMQECDICGPGQVAEWTQQGHFSKCGSCNVVKTNLDELECQCGVKSQLYSFKDPSIAQEKCQTFEARCATCFKQRHKRPETTL